jgi:serine/threonine protein kinase
MKQHDCPTRRELTAFLQGRIAAEQAGPIGEHLDSCDDCRALIDTISDRDDTLVSSLSRPVPENAYVNESAFARVESLIQAVGREHSLVEAGQAGRRADESVQELGSIGQYELLAKLGEGGMGTVYKALHTRLKKVVALKVLSENRLRDARAVARFEREVEAVGKLEHPNIVRAMDANVHEGKHYLVIEYVDGADLADLVRCVGPLSVPDACELIRQAAIGLQHAHENNLVHRDIKPSNIMLARDGQVKILDLGLARLHNGQHDELTSTGQLMGTLDYMAPEQTGHSHDVDIRADIYSLGATLYKLLCGRAPYADPRYDTAVKKLAALANEPIPPIQKQRNGIPDPLAAALHKMLVKDADERFATPREILLALAPLAAGADLKALIVRFDGLKDAENGESSPSRQSGHNTDDYLSASLTDTKSDAGSADSPAPLAAAVKTHGDGGDGQSDARPAPGPALATSPRPAKPSRRPTLLVAAALLGLAASFAAVTIVRLATDKGEIVIKSYDPQIEVTVKRNGEVVDDFQIAHRPDGTWYYSGQYEIEIKDPKRLTDEITIKNGTFALFRDKTVLVEIVRTEEGVSTPTAEHASAGLDRRGSAGSPQREVAEWVISQGGDVRIAGGDYPVVSSLEELPSTEFDLDWIAPASSKVTDDDLAKLAKLQRLPTLDLREAGITGTGFQHLRELQEIGSLYLDNCMDLDPESLQHLEGASLGGLYLLQTKCGDETMRRLPHWPNLQQLSPGANTTGEGLKLITACPKLQYLYLWGCLKLKPDDLRVLAQLQELKRVGLDPQHMTPEFMAVLAEFSRLPGLSWGGFNGVADDDLRCLEKLKNLRQLDVGATSVTAAGVERLHQALPDCEIIWTGGTVKPEPNPAQAEKTKGDERE